MRNRQFSVMLNNGRCIELNSIDTVEYMTEKKELMNQLVEHLTGKSMESFPSKSVSVILSHGSLLERSENPIGVGEFGVSIYIGASHITFTSPYASAFDEFLNNCDSNFYRSSELKRYSIGKEQIFLRGCDITNISLVDNGSAELCCNEQFIDELGNELHEEGICPDCQNQLANRNELLDKAIEDLDCDVEGMCPDGQQICESVPQETSGYIHIEELDSDDIALKLENINAKLKEIKDSFE